MARVTSSEVKEIIREDIGNTSIDAFIATATLLVDEVIVASGESTMSEARLKQIELYLAAHLLHFMTGEVQAEKIGDSSTTYASAVRGECLRATLYGQQVILMDETGLLQSSSSKINFEMVS